MLSAGTGQRDAAGGLGRAQCAEAAACIIAVGQSPLRHAHLLIRSVNALASCAGADLAPRSWSSHLSLHVCLLVYMYFTYTPKDMYVFYIDLAVTLLCAPVF